MSKQYISPTLRQHVAEFSDYRCGYCRTSQHVIGPFLEIDHIVPVSKGGTTDEVNLILACPHCNGHKSDRMTVPDPESGEFVALFNPRMEAWNDHFQWQQDGALIAGLTAIGRAPVIALAMNHPDLVTVRRLWIEAGWHPLQD